VIRDSSSISLIAECIPDNDAHVGVCIRAALPGATPYVWTKAYCIEDPEQCATAYDDISHELRTWYQMWIMALSDLCTLQESLF
jgi:hypothetical protein